MFDTTEILLNGKGETIGVHHEGKTQFFGDDKDIRNTREPMVSDIPILIRGGIVQEKEWDYLKNSGLIKSEHEHLKQVVDEMSELIKHKQSQLDQKQIYWFR